MAVRDIPCPPSANIAKVSYDDETRELYVQFQRNNIVYCYYDVPAGVADGFSTSGLRTNAYFNQSVVNQYRSQRMS